MIELDEQHTSLVIDRHWSYEAAILKPQPVEDAQRCAGKVSQFGVMTLTL